MLHRHKLRTARSTGPGPLKDLSGKLVRVEHKAYVGLGSNLGDREATMRRAVELLAATAGIEVVAVSTLRETDPVGYADQPRFLNGAAALVTELGPRALLDRLLAVERELGRVRGEGPRFGPRTSAPHLLRAGAVVVDAPGPLLPHPRLAERRFVLEPLHELDPGLRLPDGRRVSTLLQA